MVHKHDHPENDQWQPCPEGELGRLVHRLQARRKRETVQLLQQIMTGTAALFLVLMTGLYVVPRLITPTEPSYGGLACSQVHDQAAAYVAESLDAETTHLIDAHLAQCGSCRQFIEEMREQAGKPSVVGKVQPTRRQPLVVAQAP